MGFKSEHIKCLEWKDMLDFPYIPGLPKYYLADNCPLCEVWFPKGKVGRFCPCCSRRVRFKPRRYALDSKMFPVWDKMLEEYKRCHEDWQLIRPRVYKDIIDYAIVRGNV